MNKNTNFTLVSGSKPIDYQKMSCNALKRQGIYQSGIFPLKSQSDNYPHLSFCDFNYPGYDDPEMEQAIGYVGVTSEVGGVIFSVYKNGQGLGIITFEEEISNLGNHFDASKGTFLVPTEGLYTFLFSSTTDSVGPNSVDVYVNDSKKVLIHVHDDNENHKNLDHSFQLHLKPNDVVKLQISQGSLYRIRLTCQLVYEMF